jgi:hypothetical protein
MPSGGIRDSLIQRRQQQAGSVDDQRRSEDERKNTRGQTDHPRTNRTPEDHLPSACRSGADWGRHSRAVMEDDGVFFFTATANCVREVFSLGGKKLARVQVETR